MSNLGDAVRAVLSDTSNLPAEFLSYLSQYSVLNPQQVGAVIAPSMNPTGLGGATAGTRYVGATTSGAPASGYFKIGDFAIAQNGHIFVCTVAGSPGTWVDAGSGGGGTTSPLTTKGDVWTYSSTDARLAVGSNKQVLTANSGATTGNDWEYPPGYEFDYVERTTNLTVTSTSDGNGNGDAFIDGGAVTYDGSTRIKIEVSTPAIEVGSGQVGWLSLYDGTTDLGRMVVAENTGMDAHTARFLTPSAAAHTYHIRAHKTGGTVTVYGGAGGASTNMPAWYRITKA